jgi:hypothetical protein
MYTAEHRPFPIELRKRHEWRWRERRKSLQCPAHPPLRLGIIANFRPREGRLLQQRLPKERHREITPMRDSSLN